jgi:hypothetical protein
MLRKKNGQRFLLAVFPLEAAGYKPPAAGWSLSVGS